MAQNYNISITVKGKDSASGPLGKIGNAMSRVGTIMAGILGANLFARFAQGVLNLGKQVFSSVAGYERLELSLKSLIAAEISKGQIEEQVHTQFMQLTAAEQLQLMDLQDRYAGLTGELSNLEAEYQRVAAAKGATSREALNLQVELDNLRGTVSNVGANIEELEGRNNKLQESFVNVRVNTMSVKDAMEQAGPEAAELMEWVRELAILSPFDTQDVSAALRLAMAYGLTKDQAMSLTQATIDFVAATGQSGQTMERIARGLGQVQAKGRLFGEEIRQLTDAGIPVLDILAEHFGVTRAEAQALVTQGLVPAETAIKAIEEYMTGNFEGAAEAQLETWAGLANAFGDIKTLAMHDVFAQMLDAFKPFASAFVNWMVSGGGFEEAARLGERLGGFGERMALGMKNVIAETERWWHILTRVSPEGILKRLGFTDSDAEEIAAMFAKIDTAIRDGLSWLKDNLAGIISGWITFKLIFAAPAFITSLGALGTALGAVSSPIFLIAAAIGGLVAAWVNDWGGIRTSFEEWWSTFEPKLVALKEYLSVQIPLWLEQAKIAWEEVILPTLEKAKTAFIELIAPIMQIANVLMTNASLAFKTIGMILTQILWPALQTVWNFLVAFFKPIIDSVIEAFTTFLLPVLQDISAFMEETFLPVWQILLEFWEESIVPLIDVIIELFGTLFETGFRLIGDYIEKTFVPLWNDIWKMWQEKFLPVLNDVWKNLKEDLGPIMDTIAKTLLPLFKQGVEFVSSAIEALIGWINDLIDALNNLEIPAGFMPGSPPPFAVGLMAIREQMKGMSKSELPKLQSQLKALDLNQAEFLEHFVNGGTFMGYAQKHMGRPVPPDSNGGFGGGGGGHFNQTNTFNLNGSTMTKEDLIILLEQLKREEG